jgi:hypothetical protein
MKLSSGVSSRMTALGRTKAPVDISKMSGFEGEDGLLVKITFAKWVGTDTLGGEPITSWVCQDVSSKKKRIALVLLLYQLTTRHLPSASCRGRYSGTVNT